MGGAEEHRLEDLRSETQKFGEGEGSGRIPPGCHPRVLQRPGHWSRRSWDRSESQPSWTGAGTVLPPAARPWECGSPGPVTLWSGTRGWLTGVDRKHPESLSLGAWMGSWGMGPGKWQRAAKGTAQGWTCLVVGLHEALVQEKQAVPGRPPSAQVGRRMPFALRSRAPASGLAFPGRGGGLREPDLKLCLARGCGWWPGAVAPGALGEGEAWRDHLSAPRSSGDAAFTCAWKGRGRRLGRDLPLAALGRLLQNACMGQFPKRKGLAKNTPKPKPLCTF